MAANNSTFIIENGLSISSVKVIDSGGNWVGPAISAGAGATGATGPAGTISATSGPIITTNTGTATATVDANAALQIAGGAAISGNLYSSNVYTNGLFYAANGLPIQTGGGSGGLAPWVKITSNTQLNIGSQYLANTYDGSFYTTMPGIATLGDMIVIGDDWRWNTNNLIVVSNNNIIESQTGNLILDVTGVIVYLIYNGEQWQVTSTVGAAGATGASGVVGATGIQGASGVGATGIQGASGSTGAQGASGSTGIGATGSAGSASPKAVSIQAPTASENVTFFYTSSAITASSVQSVVRGSAGPSAVYSIRYSAARSNSTPTILVASHNVSNTLLAQTAILTANTSIAANQFVWLTTTATTGTVDELSVTINFQ